MEDYEEKLMQWQKEQKELKGEDTAKDTKKNKRKTKSKVIEA